MDIKKLIKYIIPPVFLDVYRSCRYGNIWEGIYKHYREVPATGQGFCGEKWVKQLRITTEELLETSKERKTIPTGVTEKHSLLPLLVSLMCYKNSGKVRVLDFGGALGADYVRLLSSVAACRSVDYYVIETERICKEGSVLFANDDRIHFCTSLPEGLSDVDIVYINSALQYIEDYEDILRKLCTYRSTYFLFVRLAAGDIPTYATAQKMAGDTIPYWVLSVKKIFDFMSTNGYSLIFKSASAWDRNQDNFPEELRLRQSCNLLFLRN